MLPHLWFHTNVLRKFSIKHIENKVLLERIILGEGGEKSISPIIFDK